MSGFEVVVRPVVFPNIRPQAPRVLPPASDPTQGVATIGGSGGRVIDLPHSWQASSSHSVQHIEIERTYDVDKISQKNDDGTINPDNFVKVERVKRMKMADKSGQLGLFDFQYLPSPPSDNVETEQTNLVLKGLGLFDFQYLPPPER